MADIDPQSSSGGVVMAQPTETGSVPPVETTPTVDPNSTLKSETFVVPPTESGHPFIPKASPMPPSGIPPTPIVHPNGGGFKRLLMIIVFVLLLGGLGAGGFFIWQMVQSGKEITITYWGLWENDATVRNLLADFKAKNPKINVQYVKQSPKQYRKRLQAAVERGEGPDVFRFHNTWVPMLVNQLQPLTPETMSAADMTSKFYPVASRDLVAGNTVYGVPTEIDGLGLYYNPDMLANAGVAPPVTWDDVMAMVPKLTVKADETIVTSAIALGTTNNIENFSDIVATMMSQNGANLTQISDKAAEDTLVFYRNFSDPSNPLYTWNETMDNSVVAFANNKVAMIIAPSWRAFEIKAMNPEHPFKIAPIPQLPNATPVTWASYWVEGVSKKSKYPKQAEIFLKYLTSDEATSSFYTEASKVRLFGPPFASRELGARLVNDPYVGAFIAQADAAFSFPLASRTFDEGLNDQLIKYLEDAINGYNLGTAPSEVLSTAATGFQQVFNTYNLRSNSVPASP